MKYIYLYTNTKNGKQYVGQTNNLERRIREHRSCAFNKKSGNYNDYFHMALRKATEANFAVKCLWEGECDQEELDRRECAAILEYNSHVSQWGYNLTWGGQGVRKDSIYADYSSEIIELLKKGASYQQIGEIYGCSPSFVSSVNHGQRFYNPNENYPLFRYGGLDPDVVYPRIVDLLQDPRYRFQEIANEVGCSYATVKAFNNGALQKGRYWSGDYPIRDRYFCNRPNWFQALNLLLSTNYSFDKISKICKIGERAVKQINCGEKVPKEGIKYPIR